ncbi:MAG: hypothetical protein AB2689_05425 [Candidatus Thiodiazotropha taylori]
MDHVRLVRSDLAFSAYTFDHQIVIPTYNLDLLQDVRLQFWGEPSQQHTTYGVYPVDIKFNLGGVDLTKWIHEEILNKIAARAASSDEYNSGMQEKLNIARQMGAAYGNPNIDEEEEVVERLANLANPGALLTQFGERKDFGWGGAFHPFNHLFKSIQIPPISLAKVLEAHNAANPQNELSPLDTPTMRISTGPLGTVATGVDLAAGRLVILAELRFHNTLKDEFERIENELNDLRDQILIELQLINDAVGPNGDFAFALTDLETEIQTIKDDSADTLAELKSQSQQLSALKTAVSELKTAVGRL